MAFGESSLRDHTRMDLKALLLLPPMRLCCCGWMYLVLGLSERVSLIPIVRLEVYELEGGTNLRCMLERDRESIAFVCCNRIAVSPPMSATRGKFARDEFTSTGPYDSQLQLVFDECVNLSFPRIGNDCVILLFGCPEEE